MVPRVDIVALNVETPFPKVIECMVEQGHSRVPVYRETLDDVVGFIHVKDVLSPVAERRVTKLSPILLGDVVLACETVAREASEQNKPIDNHLRHLVVHGVLHLLSYDHSTQAEATKMEALETAILTRLGVPDPYRDTMSLIVSEPTEP